MSDLPDAIPAATAIIFRDRQGAPPHLLMVERAAQMVFAGGAMVFPGGRIDPGDYALAGLLGDAGLAPRIAAIRETIEEAGLPIGIRGDIADTQVRAIRQALHAGATLGDAIADQGAALDLDLLVPFARWRPAHAHRRIFDTRFYLARLPADAPPPTVDATENVRLLWASARDVLDASDRGEMAVIFPTRRNLERLAQYASFDAAVADATLHPVTTVTPWIETRNGIRHLCIPQDIGYPVTSEPIDGAMRG